jgi:hypothetical protein
LLFDGFSRRAAGGKEGSNNKITGFPEDPTVGRDVPPEAMMQMITIGGRPEFVDVGRELSAAVLVLVAQRGGGTK